MDVWWTRKRRGNQTPRKNPCASPPPVECLHLVPASDCNKYAFWCVFHYASAFLCTLCDFISQRPLDPDEKWQTPSISWKYLCAAGVIKCCSWFLFFFVIEGCFFVEKCEGVCLKMSASRFWHGGCWVEVEWRWWGTNLGKTITNDAMIMMERRAGGHCFCVILLFIWVVKKSDLNTGEYLVGNYLSLGIDTQCDHLKI